MPLFEFYFRVNANDDYQAYIRANDMIKYGLSRATLKKLRQHLQIRKVDPEKKK